VETTGHCALVHVIRMRLLSGRRCELRLHLWIVPLVRALMCHHMWPWATLEVTRATMLHMRHLWLGVMWHRRITLRHWSVDVALGRVLYHHVAAHLRSMELWMAREAGSHRHH
jgi:hypothetical protein